MTADDDAASKQNGRHPFGNPAATTPGAQRVAADEAARLDQRIAEKRKSGRDAIVSPRTKIELSQFELDIAAKNAARSVAASVEVKPGAFAERRSSARTQLSELENDVAAKFRASLPGNDASMDNGQVVKPLKEGSSPPTTQPGARVELSQLESAVVAKNRQTGSNRASGRTELAQLESAIAAKSVAGNNSSSPELSTSISSPQTEEIMSTNGDHDDKEIYFNDCYDADQKLGFDFAPERAEDKDVEAAESEFNPPNQTNVAPTAAADHGMIREPAVEHGEVRQQDAVEGHAMAVAVAVADEEDCAFIPAAVQYDPDAKPPIYKNRRFRLYALGAVVLVVAVTIGVAVTVTQTRSNVLLTPTFAPTSSRENLGIRQQIQLVVGEQKLADPTSPHYRALDWIINKDPMQLQPDSVNLLQRYLAALLYYSTTEYGPWLSCNPQEKGQDETCLFAKLTNVFPNQYQQVPWIRWLSSHHECDWAGIYCDDLDRIRTLELSGNELSGRLPADVASLPFLQYLAFDWNKLYGTLPPEWGQIKYLINIEIHYNFLTGSIPDSWWGAENLQRLTMAGNQLTGSIPTDVSGLSLLKGFFTNDNIFNGTIPTEIGELEFLAYTRHSKNFFSGTIPSEMGNLINLHELWLHRTGITGSIPSEIGKLDQLQSLRLFYTGLEGSFPSEFYNLSQLTQLEIYNCNMTGSISSDIGNLAQLTTLHIRNNELSGTIPTEIGHLTLLQDVWLQGNRFNGTIPMSLCDVNAQVLQADCSNNNQTEAPAIICPLQCCSTCCAQDSGTCISQFSS